MSRPLRGELPRINRLVHKANQRMWRRYDRFMQREGWKEPCTCTQDGHYTGEVKKFRPLTGDDWHLYREADRLLERLYRVQRAVKWRSVRPEVSAIEDAEAGRFAGQQDHK